MLNANINVAAIPLRPSSSAAVLTATLVRAQSARLSVPVAAVPAFVDGADRLAETSSFEARLAQAQRRLMLFWSDDDGGNDSRAMAEPRTARALCANIRHFAVDDEPQALEAFFANLETEIPLLGADDMIEILETLVRYPPKKLNFPVNAAPVAPSGSVLWDEMTARMRRLNDESASSGAVRPYFNLIAGLAGALGHPIFAQSAGIRAKEKLRALVSERMQAFDHSADAPSVILSLSLTNHLAPLLGHDQRARVAVKLIQAKDRIPEDARETYRQTLDAWLANLEIEALLAQLGVQTMAGPLSDAVVILGYVEEHAGEVSADTLAHVTADMAKYLNHQSGAVRERFRSYFKLWCRSEKFDADQRVMIIASIGKALPGMAPFPRRESEILYGELTGFLNDDELSRLFLRDFADAQSPEVTGNPDLNAHCASLIRNVIARITDKNALITQLLDRLNPDDAAYFELVLKVLNLPELAATSETFQALTGVIRAKTGITPSPETPGEFAETHSDIRDEYELSRALTALLPPERDAESPLSGSAQGRFKTRWVKALPMLKNINVSFFERADANPGMAARVLSLRSDADKAKLIVSLIVSLAHRGDPDESGKLKAETVLRLLLGNLDADAFRPLSLLIGQLGESGNHDDAELLFDILAQASLVRPNSPHWEGVKATLDGFVSTAPGIPADSEPSRFVFEIKNRYFYEKVGTLMNGFQDEVFDASGKIDRRLLIAAMAAYARIDQRWIMENFQELRAAAERKAFGGERLFLLFHWGLLTHANAEDLLFTNDLPFVVRNGAKADYDSAARDIPPELMNGLLFAVFARGVSYYGGTSFGPVMETLDRAREWGITGWRDLQLCRDIIATYEACPFDLPNFALTTILFSGDEGMREAVYPVFLRKVAKQPFENWGEPFKVFFKSAPPPSGAALYRQATRVLVESSDPSAAGLILDMLYRGNPSLYHILYNSPAREAAALVFPLLAERIKYVPKLWEYIKGNPPESSRSLFLLALAPLGGDETARSILSQIQKRLTLEDTGHNTLRIAAEAFRRLPDVAPYVEDLIQALPDTTDPYDARGAHSYVILALGYSGDPRALAPLRKAKKRYPAFSGPCDQAIAMIEAKGRQS